MRVKLYWLDEEANWLDKGTGNMEFEDGIFAIKSEENNSLLLRHRLSSAIDYSKQQETLISWSISKDHMYAVSFQDPKECDLIWDAIHDGNQSLLPVLTRDTLAITEATCFECCKSLFGKDQLANFVIHENYLNKSLIPLFIKCEELYLDFQDEASLENLNCISCIFKSLVSLNEHSILESILTDFTNTLGIVECNFNITLDDREFKNIRANYRDYVSNSVKFKQIIPFPEPIKDTINLVYRIMYLRDIAWARWVDESTFSHLAQVITSHMIDIFGFIQTNESFLKNLFALFNSGDNEKKNEIIFFLVELFHHLKQQQVPPIARTNMLRFLLFNIVLYIKTESFLYSNIALIMKI